MAGISLGSKLLIVRYGLPLEFNPDEPYILKEPFKLAYLYSHGVFAYTTNMLYWILQIWYGLLFVAGRAVSYWTSVAAFKEALVAEAGVLLLWGRLLGVLTSACAIFVLARLIVRTTSGRWSQVLIAGSLALNPIDLVATPWLKFDGVAALLNAILIVAFVRYLESQSTRDRRRLYVLVILACALRTDFILFPPVLVAYDWWRRRPFRDVLTAALAGVALYSLVTLAPLVYVYQWATANRAVPSINVSGTFEAHIFNRLVSDWRTGALLRNPAAGLKFYTPILLNVGLPFIVLAWRGLRRTPHAQLMLGLACSSFALMLIPSSVATRYALPLSVYLLLGAGWAINHLRRPALRLGLAIGCFGIAASLTIEILGAILTKTDPRIDAADYLLSHSRASDVIAVEDYINPGRHAALSECPDELRKKAAATIESKSGSGETFAAWAARPAGNCRRIIEIADTDRFAGSSYRGRWINTYDPEALGQLATPPQFFTTNLPYSPLAAARHPSFAQFVLAHYDLVQIFEPRYVDPRIRVLLEGTPYFVRLYVYQRKS